MAQLDHQAHWLATQNIARFEQHLKTETDISRRKMLENLLVLEREKLSVINAAAR